MAYDYSELNLPLEKERARISRELRYSEAGGPSPGNPVCKMQSSTPSKKVKKEDNVPG